MWRSAPDNQALCGGRAGDGGKAWALPSRNVFCAQHEGKDGYLWGGPWASSCSWTS